MSLSTMLSLHSLGPPLWGGPDSYSACYSSYSEFLLCYGSKGSCLLILLHHAKSGKPAEVTNEVNVHYAN